LECRLFYTGLRLNCTLDPGNNSTIPPRAPSVFLNFTNATLVRSEAGANGLGEAFPPGDNGFSLNATYDKGIIGANINCSCPASVITPPPPPVNQTCDYALGGNLRCVQGQVSTCNSVFLRCFPTVPPPSNNAPVPAANNSFYCFANGTIVEAPVSNGNATAPPGSTQCNNTAAPLALVLPPGSGPSFQVGAFTCLGSFPPGTNFTVLSTLNATLYRQICDAGPCPPVSSNLTAADALVRCASCNETVLGVVESVILNTRACGPYGCRRIAQATCNYTYEHSWNGTSGGLPAPSDSSNSWNAFFWGHVGSYSTDQLPPFFYNVTITVTFDPDNPPALLCPNPNLAVHLFTVDKTDPTAPEVISLSVPPEFRDIVAAIQALQQATDQNTLNTIARAFQDACLNNMGDFFNRRLDGVLFCDWVEYQNFTLVSQTAAVLVPYPYNETASACPSSPIGCIGPANSTCSCDPSVLAVCGTSYPVGNQAASFEFDNINDKMRYVNLADNRAQQHAYGMMLNRTSEFIIRNMTTVLTGNGFSSENARLRWLYLWDGEFITGTVHDYYYGIFNAATSVLQRAFSFSCDDGCNQPFVLASDFPCQVDASTPVPKINTTYKTIQGAIDDGCADINIRAYGKFIA
jgi:hypothetical protein